MVGLDFMADQFSISKLSLLSLTSTEDRGSFREYMALDLLFEELTGERMADFEIEHRGFAVVSRRALWYHLKIA